MIGTTVDKSAKDKLYMSLYSYCGSLQRRGVTIIPQAHSGRFGSLDVTVVGVRGIARKTIVLSFDSKDSLWIATFDGSEYYLSYLSEITTLVRSVIARLNTVVSKI